MYTDLFGKKRMKINLHMHTTESDGAKSVAEAIQIYKSQGYDAVALTDHWKISKSGYIDGVRIISGVEYNTQFINGKSEIYHILGINCKTEPNLKRSDSAQTMIDEINKCGGIPILAHPAWSLNAADQGYALKNFDITEIYNSASDAGQSARPYSGDFVDTLAFKGKYCTLIAVDDTHFYDGTDETKSYIMLECDEEATDDDIVQAIKDKKFYSTQGPELLCKKVDNKIIIDCSPVCRIMLFSNLVWGDGHSVRGKDLTRHEYIIDPEEYFIRAEVVDEQGRYAWSNIIELK